MLVKLMQKGIKSVPFLFERPSYLKYFYKTNNQVLQKLLIKFLFMFINKKHKLDIPIVIVCLAINKIIKDSFEN